MMNGRDPAVSFSVNPFYPGEFQYNWILSMTGEFQLNWIPSFTGKSPA
jgi:hypothetical protein